MKSAAPLFRIPEGYQTAFPAALFLLFALTTIDCAASRRATGETIRLMTWNIHHAEGIDRTIDIDRIAKLILSEKVDIVALQEVDRGVERSKKVDMITRLADLTEMTYAFGKTSEIQKGDFGNAFLTRFPILEERNILFSRIPGDQQNGLHILVLGIRGDEMVIANTQLDSRTDDTARVANASELLMALKPYGNRATIVCGDLNDSSTSRTVTLLKRDFSDAWEQSGKGTGYTYPTASPRQRNDYIFVLKNPKPDSASTPVHLRPVAARVLSSSASDHVPLVVNFELTSER